jgi:hypothetical protein
MIFINQWFNPSSQTTKKFLSLQHDIASPKYLFVILFDQAKTSNFPSATTELPQVLLNTKNNIPILPRVCGFASRRYTIIIEV